jgi:hypothetical protein
MQGAKYKLCERPLLTRESKCKEGVSVFLPDTATKFGQYTLSPLSITGLRFWG